MKIFCVGMHKAGTSSIDMLLALVGLRTHHNTTWSRPPLSKDFLDRYDVFSDGGAHYWQEGEEFGGNHDLRGLRALYPDCRFILQYRPMRSWLASKMAHSGWTTDTVLGPDTGAPLVHDDWKTDRRMEALRAWAENRVKYHQAACAYLATLGEDALVIDVTQEPDAARRIFDFAVGPGRHVAVDRINRLHRLRNRFGYHYYPRAMPHANEARANPEDKKHCRGLADRAVADLEFDVEPEILELKAGLDRAVARG